MKMIEGKAVLYFANNKINIIWRLYFRNRSIFVG